MSFDSLPDGWTVWNDEPGGKGILAYRPDVFDTQAFPAPCLPTIFVTNGPLRRRPGARTRDATWRVVLYLEPDVRGPVETYDSREGAVEGAVDLARRFAEGELDYRSLYQLPREGYLDELDGLTGRGE
ncbi:MAG: DUF5820 family protein [Salinigranum sp.]